MEKERYELLNAIDDMLSPDAIVKEVYDALSNLGFPEGIKTSVVNVISKKSRDRLKSVRRIIDKLV